MNEHVNPIFQSIFARHFSYREDPGFIRLSADELLCIGASATPRLPTLAEEARLETRAARAAREFFGWPGGIGRPSGEFGDADYDAAREHMAYGEEDAR